MSETTTATPAADGARPAPEGTAGTTPGAAENAQTQAETPAAPAPADTEQTEPQDEKELPAWMRRELRDQRERRRNAEREAQYWRDQALRAALERQEQRPPAAPQHGQPAAAVQLPPDLAAFVGQEPKPEDFPAGEYDPGYARAVARYEARRSQAEIAAHQRVAAMQAQQHQAIQTVKQRLDAIVEEGRRTFPDFDETVNGIGDYLTDTIRVEIAELERPAAVAHWLGKNPEVAAKLAKLPRHAVARELGRIEARLASAPPPPKPTAAPSPPAQTARGGGATARPLDPERMTAKEYYEARMRGDLP